MFRPIAGVVEVLGPKSGYNLIITNGDAAGEVLRKAFTGTEVLPWRDVLHEGPVPLTDTFEELSELRADFLAERNWGDPDILRENFQARDRGLAHHEVFENVTLWFEHDLYDQLQLIQILDWFHGHPGRGAGLQLVQSDDFLGVQNEEKIKTFKDKIKDASEEQLALACAAWAAFRQPEPTGWAGLLRQDLSPLPYLAQSVRRMLQELPGVTSGLARTQNQILMAINGGVGEPRQLFGAVEKMEEAAFMGDWSFWVWLDGLAADPGALIESLEVRFSPDMSEEEFKAYIASPLRLTALGLQVLGGGADYTDAARIERWIGGTHLTNDNLWRWDEQKAELIESA
ncbi:MAG: DUF1835 domain-containing protein [Gammaproteobacteria bacterium]